MYQFGLKRGEDHFANMIHYHRRKRLVAPCVVGGEGSQKISPNVNGSVQAFNLNVIAKDQGARVERVKGNRSPQPLQGV